MKKSIEERFNKYCSEPDSNGCINWLGGVMSGGYGCLRVNRKMQQAPRISWTLFIGPIPNSLWVLHKCDNRLCVNNEHLFLGTRQDNINDMIRKDRNSKGLKHILISGKPKTAKKHSKYKGVYWSKKYKKWVSQAMIYNKRIYIGAFKKEKDAHNSYTDFLNTIQTHN